MSEIPVLGVRSCVLGGTRERREEYKIFHLIRYFRFRLTQNRKPVFITIRYLHIIVQIFIDESGDLGFTQNSSEFYVIGFVILPNDEDLIACLNHAFLKTRKKFDFSEKKLKEFHHNKCKIEVRRSIFHNISRCGVDFAYLILEKSQVYPDLRSKHDITNNYLVGQLLKHVLHKYPDHIPLKITMDKNIYTKELERNFSHYISNTLISDSGNGLILGSQIKIEHLSSHSSYGIQAADFIASGVSRYHRGKDREELYAIFEPKVKLALNYYNGPIKGLK